MSFMETLDRFGIATESEISMLEATGTDTFGKLVEASKQKPLVFEPILRSYTRWFNNTIAPRARMAIN